MPNHGLLFGRFAISVLGFWFLFVCLRFVALLLAGLALRITVKKAASSGYIPFFLLSPTVFLLLSQPGSKGHPMNLTDSRTVLGLVMLS